MKESCSTGKRGLGALLLIVFLVGSACDLIEERLRELPESRPEPAESKAEKGKRRAPSGSIEEPTADGTIEGYERRDEAWEPTIMLVPEPDANALEQKEPAPLILTPGEELWIVVPARIEEKRHRETSVSFSAASKAAEIGRGVSRTPIQRTDVSVTINGMISSVTLSQVFRNTQAAHIDVPYHCPLPSNAALTDFTATIGERRIRGIVREREQAEEIYELARSRGLIASLVRQEAANTLQLTVSNVPPGQLVEVNLNFVHTLSWIGGALEFALPLAPPSSRTVPTTPSDTDDARDSLHRRWEISAEIQIDAGVPIGSISSPTHEIVTEQPTPRRASVVMSQVGEEREEEFIVRFAAAGATACGALFTQRQDDLDYFSLILYPPRDLETLKRTPIDLVLLLDCSKSMRGKALYQAKRFAVTVLRQLTPTDSFRIVTFDGMVLPTSDNSMPATASNVRQASTYVDALRPHDGESMMRGLEIALATQQTQGNLPVLIGISDGYGSNDAEILSYLDKHVGRTRIFCIGMGEHLNTHLLEDMAMMGRGGVVYVQEDIDAADMAETFFAAISRPVASDLEIEWGGMEIDGLLPGAIPDLFIGRPLLLTGRYHGKLPSGIAISGRAGGKHVDFSVSVDPEEVEVTRPGVPVVWARKRISELIRQAMIDPTLDVLSLGKQLSVEHRIVSPFASFIIVDTKSGH